MRRWTLFAAGIALSVALTAALWMAGVKGGALLLLFPFLWLPFGRRAGPPEIERSCPKCGYASADPEHRHCPRDGELLV